MGMNGVIGGVKGGRALIRLQKKAGKRKRAWYIRGRVVNEKRCQAMQHNSGARHHEGFDFQRCVGWTGSQSRRQSFDLEPHRHQN